ncbi:MAG: sulfotransferase [Melioribacteraceae bacterium]|nr:sulfotransferase [Melioribacteraceae bacterium]MCF8355562.1 sulfotransferase [Melioribacteraceae bacterium]MCF8394237.1 sulfotransferase [Melioribacteraceae bacterium]MCF8419958.1 sulfotransferase [Melioribacteraceae bacterium]
MKAKPIFILGCHKSGTTLLRNLLDDHKELFVVPTETHFFANIGFGVKYTYRKTNNIQLTIEEKKKRLINWIDYRNRKEDLIADGFTKNKWNLEKLTELMMKTEVNNLKELSDLFHTSLYFSLFGESPPQNKRFVEKSVENSEFVSNWLSIYPDAKFVHILRNPYSNIVSLRKYSSKKKKNLHFPHLLNPINSMYDSYNDLYKNLKTYSNYLVVKYEDLLTNTKTSMIRIADFLEIKYDEQLLNPTILGEDWKGNSIRGKKFNGVSSQNIDVWKNEISDFEIIIINKFFDFILNDYDYDILTPNNTSIFKRAPKESFKNYILNRILLLSLR